MNKDAAFGCDAETETLATVGKSASGKPLSRVAAMAMFLTSLVISGVNGVFASAVSLPSFEIVIIRATFSAALLGIALVVMRQPLVLLKRKREAALVVLAGLFLAGDWAFLFEAYEHAGLGMGTILRYTGPAFVMLLSPLVFREKLTVPKLIGFGIVVAGAVLVNGVALQGGSFYGIAVGLVSGVCFGSVIMVNKKIVHVVGVEKVFLEIGVAAVALLLVGIFVKGVTFNVQPTDIAPLAALVIVTAVGNYMYLRGMEGISVQSVSVLGYLEPLSAVFFGMLLLGETMVPVQATGAALIICGAVLCELGGKLKMPKPRSSAAAEPVVAVVPATQEL